VERPGGFSTRWTRRPGWRGAAQLDGKMIDAASARMAQNVVDTAEAIGAK
jgi:citrate lyase beta subunit